MQARRQTVGPAAAAVEEGVEMQTPAEAIFATVDRDGSGSISFDEFATWWSRRTVATTGEVNAELMGEMQAMWSQYDVDSSGALVRAPQARDDV